MKATSPALALLLAACSSRTERSEVGETGGGGEPCDSRGQAVVDVGSDVSGTFRGFSDQEPISPVAGADGFYALQLELRTTGMDTYGLTDIAVQVALGGETRESIDSLAFRCQDDGVTGVATATALLPEAAATDPAAYDSATLGLAVIVTDAAGADDEWDGALVLDSGSL